MQQRPGHRDVPIDSREGGRDRSDRLGDGQTVLKQTVPVGLVVALGRRRVAVVRPSRRLRAEDQREQPLQVRILDRRDQPSQVGLHLIGAAGRTVEQLLEAELVVGDGAHGLDRELGAETGVNGEAAADVHDLTASAQLANCAHVLADHRGHTSGAVAELQLQILGPVAPGAHLRFTDEERLRDIDSVCKFPDFHGFAKIEWRADGS